MNSCVRRSGSRLTSTAPTPWAKRQTVSKPRLAIQRDHDVKALRARGLDPARQAELREQVAHRERGRAQAPRARPRDGVEVEHAQVGPIERRDDARSRRAA